MIEQKAQELNALIAEKGLDSAEVKAFLDSLPEDVRNDVMIASLAADIQKDAVEQAGVEDGVSAEAPQVAE